MKKVVDFHTHLGRFRFYPVPRLSRERTSTIEDFGLLGRRRKVICVPIITAHLDGKDGQSEFKRLVAKVEANPSLFAGLAFWLDGHNFKRSAVIAKSLPQPLLKYLKIQSSIDKLPLTNKVYYKIVDLAWELNLPLLIHCTRVEEFVDFKALEKLVTHRPEVIKILAHMGGCYLKNTRQALQIMRKCPSSLMGTSSLFPGRGVGEVVRAVGSERLLFGSDFPLLDFDRQYAGVAKAKISPKDKENILFKNAVKLLGLDI